MNLKELWHKLSWRKIEFVSRIDKDTSEKLMSLLKQKSVNHIRITDRFELDKIREHQDMEIDVYFKPIKSLNQYNDILTCLEPFGLSFKKHILSGDNGFILVIRREILSLPLG